ncbi:hypothetical protein [Deinococcus apachensis]|uniref:hypothetical protein n=1 Tax=Deinococcus apachensis TaxID=309886 RepID=UPI00036BA131|nr:hypothetical protein [Deinococcus apachensis]
MNVQDFADSQPGLEDQAKQQGVPGLLGGNLREDALDLFPLHIADGLYTVLPGQASDPQVRQQVRQALLGYLTLALNEPQ